MDEHLEWLGEEERGPSEELLRRVVSSFRHHRRRAAQRTAEKALLHFDSWTRMTPMGVRGVAQERQVLFSTPTLDVDFQITREPASEHFTLRGQILGEYEDSLEGIEVRLYRKGMLYRRVLTDALGCFVFSLLPEGSYTLRVILDDQEIVVEPVDLHAYGDIRA